MAALTWWKCNFCFAAAAFSCTKCHQRKSDGKDLTASLANGRGIMIQMVSLKRCCRKLQTDRRLKRMLTEYHYHQRWNAAWQQCVCSLSLHHFHTFRAEFIHPCMHTRALLRVHTHTAALHHWSWTSDNNTSRLRTFGRLSHFNEYGVWGRGCFTSALVSWPSTQFTYNFSYSCRNTELWKALPQSNTGHWDVSTAA